jgi:hypothetical protein
MKEISEMTNGELAAYVQSHLRSKGIDVVLSGGACVSIYSGDKYVSMDLDLINTRFARRRRIREAIQEIGFTGKGRHFTHPDTEFLVEFPQGPLSVGNEPVKKVDEHMLTTGVLRIISPTDCVKDRLAGYYHWNDLQCLEQASMVAEANKIDIAEVERWSKAQEKHEEFTRVKNRLTGRAGR